GLSHHNLCDLLEQSIFLLVNRDKRRISTYVFLQMLHIYHTAQYRKYSFRSASITECPCSGRVLRTSMFEQMESLCIYPGQTSTQKGLHNQCRNFLLNQFAKQVFGIDIIAGGMSPVDEVYLNQCVIPLDVHCQHTVKCPGSTMKSLPQFTYTTAFSLYNQEFEHSLVPTP